jgi:hypothetical protein
MYGDRRGTYRVLEKTLRDTDHLEDLGLDGKLILKLNFKNRDEEAWTGLIWLRIGRAGGLL